MFRRNAAVGRRTMLKSALALALATALEFAVIGSAAAEETPTPTATLPPTATATVEPTVPATAEPTRTPKPTATPSPSPTPLPAQDLAVSFFNNFCEAGEPLLATIFNTSATPLEGRTVRLRLTAESGLLEEHDHYLSLAPYSTANLPLLNPATPPWVQVEIQMMDGPEDPNLTNNSISCGVGALPATEATPTIEADALPESGSVAPGSASRAAPPPASGIGSSVWRQVTPTATAAPVLQPTLAPLAAPASQPIANSPQPSLTPIGDAGGGLAPASTSAFPSKTLMMTGVVLLATGSSWAFYYLTRPPRSA
jgi:hypothetical protein